MKLGSSWRGMGGEARFLMHFRFIPFMILLEVTNILLKLLFLCLLMMGLMIQISKMMSEADSADLSPSLVEGEVELLCHRPLVMFISPSIEHYLTNIR